MLLLGSHFSYHSNMSCHDNGVAMVTSAAVEVSLWIFLQPPSWLLAVSPALPTRQSSPCTLPDLTPTTGVESSLGDAFPYLLHILYLSHSPCSTHLPPQDWELKIACRDRDPSSTHICLLLIFSPPSLPPSLHLSLSLPSLPPSLPPFSPSPTSLPPSLPPFSPSFSPSLSPLFLPTASLT